MNYSAYYNIFKKITYYNILIKPVIPVIRLQNRHFVIVINNLVTYTSKVTQITVSD